MRKKEYLKSRSVIVQGIHSPKRFWFACGLSLGLVSLPLSTFANNWSNQLGSSIQKSIQQNRIITGSVIDESGEALIGVSVLVLINTFDAARGVKVPHKIVGRREGDIEKVWANPERANKVLGWKATETLADTLASAWKWQERLRERGIM